jgi:two-component system, OmpR family, sensor kinase
MLGRLPIRMRLTAAFALAIVVVLVAMALFVYVRQRADLDETIDDGLRSRSDNVAALVRQSNRGLAGDQELRLAESEESFAQLLTPAGRLVDGTRGPRKPALSAVEARRAARAPTFFEHDVAGIDGPARVLARPVTVGARPLIVVTGTQMEDRNDALSGLVTSFLIGGTIAVLVASGVGYLLATAGLAPIEAMRQRAMRISLSRGRERLPLPESNDEVRRLGETLNAMLARLEASLERERRFVADAGHELRTPLAVAKTELEVALRTTSGDAETRLSLLTALEEMDNLVQLADDLLLVARAGEGQLALRREELRMDELLDQTRQRFADRAREQGREIRVEAPAGMTVSLDPIRIRQALANLVNNALGHGAGVISLSARAGAGGVEIDVGDEGPGFPPELVPRAFERFAGGGDARSQSGSGLGLAIVRAIAEAHGGTATIVEQPTGGGRVRLFIPAAAGGDGRGRRLSSQSQAGRAS